MLESIVCVYAQVCVLSCVYAHVCVSCIRIRNETQAIICPIKKKKKKKPCFLNRIFRWPFRISVLLQDLFQHYVDFDYIH